MGKSITLFSGYSQAENRTTNYCLLILKMLYEENPKFLSEVLSSLVSEDLGRHIGVQFRQQETHMSSVPDGLISQDAFTIYIETKNFDWFYDDQLKRHLKELMKVPGLKVLLALSNFETRDDARFDKVRALCKDLSKNQREPIMFGSVNFEDLVGAIPIDKLPKNLADAVRDFKMYLDEQNLLPSWERWLDVANCAGIPDDILVGKVYMCPATGGAYSHKRCKFFGMYRNKRVEMVAHIDAVIDVEDEEHATLRWRNVSDRDADALCEEARSKVASFRSDEYPTRVFLLGPLYKTDFLKDSPGGMQTSKRYFDIGGFGELGAEELANVLRGKTWSEVHEQNSE